MFGAISREMICLLFEPLSRASPTKSREVRENVCARSARAAHGHDVSPMKIDSVITPRTFRYAAITSRSANVGMTSTTFVSMLRISSTIPPR